MRRKRAASTVEAYEAFAYAYDQALGHRFYEAARPFLNSIFERYPVAQRTHLDVACGTGHLVADLRKEGWRSLGVDISLPMLEVAQRRTHGLVCADFRALPFSGAFALVTCLYDSFNHLRMRNDLVDAFRAVAQVMEKDSLFVFDMNHPEAYETVWAATEPYIATGRDYRLEMATSFRKRDQRARALVTGWAVLPGKKERVEIREVREQRAWNEREITESLTDAGLAPLEVLDFDPYNEDGDESAPGVKLVFVCRRAK
jgi:SAM-dependent methyltransferase